MQVPMVELGLIHLRAAASSAVTATGSTQLITVGRIWRSAASAACTWSRGSLRRGVDQAGGETVEVFPSFLTL